MSSISKQSFRDRYFGDKAFYAKVFAVALPIMIQNGLTNFVNLLDNLMVGRIGTDQMSGVSIVNQLIFVFNLSVFGALAGAGIFLTQYFGSGDHENMRNVFRMKFILGAVITALGIGILYFGKETLIDLFLHDGSVTGDLDATLNYALQYIQIIFIGLIPFTITQIYASSLRETEETVLPMLASVVSVFVDLVFNYILIYGKFGLPVLGVRGAAIATVMARFVECLIVVLWSVKNSKKYPYMRKVFYKFHVPAQVAKQVILKGTPLLLNEFLWATAMTMLTFCYSTRGLDAIAGINICNTLNNVFNISFISMGSAVSILVGQLLGAGRFEDAKACARKMMVFSTLFCAILAILMAMAAPAFPNLYNTSEEVRWLATQFIWIMAGIMPFCALTNATYFTLRSGGKTGITFVFDSCFAWGVNVTIAAALAFLTPMPVVPLFLICQSLEIVKCVIGLILVNKGIWIKNLNTSA